MPQYFAPRISAIFINLMLDIGIAISVLALFFTMIQQMCCLLFPDIVHMNTGSGLNSQFHQMRARTDALLGNLRVEEIGMVNV
jgi:hypothetical protein